MDRRGFGSGNIAKMCICLTLLLLSSTENSFVTTLPAAEEKYQAKRTGTPIKGGARRMMIYTPPTKSARAGWVDRSHSDHGQRNLLVTWK
ncbi:hypothetical protein Bca101_057175 [Brassica carinata]